MRTGGQSSGTTSAEETRTGPCNVMLGGVPGRRRKSGLWTVAAAWPPPERKLTFRKLSAEVAFPSAVRSGRLRARRPGNAQLDQLSEPT